MIKIIEKVGSPNRLDAILKILEINEKDNNLNSIKSTISAYYKWILEDKTRKLPDLKLMFLSMNYEVIALDPEIEQADKMIIIPIAIALHPGLDNFNVPALSTNPGIYSYNCNSCSGLAINNISYRCEKCDFDLCEKCVKSQDLDLVDLHIHKMFKDSGHFNCAAIDKINVTDYITISFVSEDQDNISETSPEEITIDI